MTFSVGESLLKIEICFWHFTREKGNEEVKFFYSFFCGIMYEVADMLEIADDIKKFAISAEFKLLKHEDKVEIAIYIYIQQF